jgi:hypothetical protein
METTRLLALKAQIAEAQNPFEEAERINSAIQEIRTAGSTFDQACKILKQSGIKSPENAAKIVRIQSKTTKALLRGNVLVKSNGVEIARTETKLGRNSEAIETRAAEAWSFVQSFDLEAEKEQRMIREKTRDLIRATLLDHDIPLNKSEKRANLRKTENPIVEAYKYKQLIEASELPTLEKAAAEISKDDPNSSVVILNYIRLLQLPPRIITIMRQGHLKASIAQEVFIHLNNTKSSKYMARIAELMEEFLRVFKSEKDQEEVPFQFLRQDIEALVKRVDNEEVPKPIRVPKRRTLERQNIIARARTIRRVLDKSDPTMTMAEFGNRSGYSKVRIFKILQWLRPIIPPCLLQVLEAEDITESTASKELLPHIERPEFIETVLTIAFHIEKPANRKTVQIAIRLAQNPRSPSPSLNMLAHSERVTKAALELLNQGLLDESYEIEELEIAIAENLDIEDKSTTLNLRKSGQIIEAIESKKRLANAVAKQGIRRQPPNLESRQLSPARIEHLQFVWDITTVNEKPRARWHEYLKGNPHIMKEWNEFKAQTGQNDDHLWTE